MTNKIAIFPGSFDPFTIGHADIVKLALPLFDKIIIAIGENIDKKSYFPLDERLSAIRSYFANEKKIEVASYSCLTADFAREHNASYVIRGVRSTIDFEYEKQMADANRIMTERSGEPPSSRSEQGTKRSEQGTKRSETFPTTKRSETFSTTKRSLETILFIAKPELAHISSSFVRDLHKHGKDISCYIKVKVES